MYSAQLLPRAVRELVESQLKQLLKATPKLVYYDTVPVVPKWLYDQMELMDDG